MAAAVFLPVLDKYEAYSWSWRVAAEEIGEEAAWEKYPRINLPDLIAQLLPSCDNDPNTLLEVMEAWSDVRSEKFEEAGDQDRSFHVAGIYLSAGLPRGSGNLFAVHPPEGAGAYVTPSTSPTRGLEPRARRK